MKKPLGAVASSCGGEGDERISIYQMHLRNFCRFFFQIVLANAKTVDPNPLNPKIPAHLDCVM